jgi:outer membrane biosynthesis protein TonB
MRALNRFGQSLLVAAVLAAGMPALAQETRRVAPEQLSNDWILINNRNEGIQVDVPNSGVNLYKPGCVAVTYTIGSDGIPMNIQVAKVAPPSDLGKAAVSAVSKFRYGPSLTNKHEDPVSTYYIVPFNAPDDKAQQAALTAPCKLPGYGN